MRRLFAVTVLVPALALSACGSGATNEAQRPRKPVDIVRLAGENTAEAATAKMAMTADVGGFAMNMDGVVSFEETKAAMTMSMDIGGGQRFEMEMRMIGEVIYMKLPPGAQEGGKPWASLDLEELSEEAGFDIAQLQQLKGADPTASLAYFEGVSDSVKEVGKEDVRGEPTTKYEVTFNIDKALAEVDDPKAKQALADATAKLGVNEIPSTVWIDGDGRLRKMVQTLDLSKIADAQAQGASGALTTTMEFYDFGTELDVEPPPANQVGDGSALLRVANG